MSAFIAGFVSTPFSFHPSRAASRRLSSSAIHFAEHNVEGPDDGHDVGHQVGPQHWVKRLQIHKRRRTNAHAIRLNSCVADDIVAELALGRFDRVVHLPHWRLEHFADARHDRPGGNVLDSLQADQARLPHLFYAHQVAVVGVPVPPSRNLKFVLVVSGVGHGLADVPLYPARAENRSGDSEINGLLRREHPDALRAPQPDAVLRQQVLVLSDLVLEILAEALDVFFQFVVGLVLQAANAKGMRGKPRAAVLLDNFENLLALPKAVEQRSQRADIERVSAEPEQVAGNALQLGEDGADDASARRRLRAQQLFDRLAIAQAVTHRGHVIHAVHVWSKLLVAAMLSDLLHAAVQIPDHAL